MSSCRPIKAVPSDRICSTLTVLDRRIYHRGFRRKIDVNKGFPLDMVQLTDISGPLSTCRASNEFRILSTVPELSSNSESHLNGAGSLSGAAFQPMDLTHQISLCVGRGKEIHYEPLHLPFGPSAAWNELFTIKGQCIRDSVNTQCSDKWRRLFLQLLCANEHRRQL